MHSCLPWCVKMLCFTVFGQWRKVCRKRKNILAFCSDFSAGAAAVAAVVFWCASFRMDLPWPYSSCNQQKYQFEHFSLLFSCSRWFGRSVGLSIDRSFACPAQWMHRASIEPSNWALWIYCMRTKTIEANEERERGKNTVQREWCTFFWHFHAQQNSDACRQCVQQWAHDDDFVWFSCSTKCCSTKCCCCSFFSCFLIGVVALLRRLHQM